MGVEGSNFRGRDPNRPFLFGDFPVPFRQIEAICYAVYNGYNASLLACDILCIFS